MKKVILIEKCNDCPFIGSELIKESTFSPDVAGFVRVPLRT